uniref:Uncharacterized protein n=1 Tax=Oryza nivara TaxID=4536 RepID=A0A0E0IM25_ORYNI
MASSISVMASAGRNRGVGFAKLQGEDFEYFMQTYSIILGRDSKREKVVVLLNWTPKTSFRLDIRNSTFSCQLDLSSAPPLISMALVPLLLFSLLTMAPLLMSIISLQVLLLSLLILAPPLLLLILALLNLVKLASSLFLLLISRTMLKMKI